MDFHIRRVRLLASSVTVANVARQLGTRGTMPRLLHPKAAHLDALFHTGVQIPPGVVLSLDEPVDIPAVNDLLACGPVIVRSALANEDGPVRSQAGLGQSIANCMDIQDVVEAVAKLRTHNQASQCQLLIQQQVAACELAVVACYNGAWFVELYPHRGSETLAGAQIPSFSGPLDWLEPDTRRQQLQNICDHVRRQAHVAGLDLDPGLDPDSDPNPGLNPDHLDLEIACTQTACWLVQARPLTAALAPDCAPFFARLAAQSPRPDLGGLLALDAEHNPEPLSPAHQSLIEWLKQHVAEAQSLEVLAGWLYLRRAPPSPTQPPADKNSLLTAARAAYQRLRTRDIPAARAQLDGFRDRFLRCHERTAWRTTLEAALQAFATIYRAYIRHNLGGLGRALEPLVAWSGATERPTCLFDRGQTLDVLPLCWDIQSPSLATYLGTVASVPAPPEPTDNELATALGELDDHLFALGLAMVACGYRRAGQLFGFGEDVFYLRLEHLLAASCTDFGENITRQKQLYQQVVRAPEFLYHGAPLSLPGRRHLRGMGIGAPFCGRLAIRRSLADVLQRPLADGEILAIPALTAQAAVVLHQLGIAAVCCEYGGWMSHAAIMSRELGLSALVGCRGCCELDDGLRVELDTVGGRLRLLAQGETFDVPA